MSADWSLARSPASTPIFLAPPMSLVLFPQATTAAKMAASSGPVHHRYGEPNFVQSEMVVHSASIGVCPCWVTQSSLSPVQAPIPSMTANTGGLPSVHCLHSACMPASFSGS